MDTRQDKTCDLMRTVGGREKKMAFGKQRHKHMGRARCSTPPRARVGSKGNLGNSVTIRKASRKPFFQANEDSATYKYCYNVYRSVFLSEDIHIVSGR